MYVYYNPNPKMNHIGDCTVRAISKLTGNNWEDTFIDLCVEGLSMCDMPSANAVWGAYLYKNGYRRNIIPNTCPDCYTVRDFCTEHPEGQFLLATGTHVIAVEEGNYYDTWDSGDEIPIYFWRKEM